MESQKQSATPAEPPTSLVWKDFENLLLLAAERAEEAGRLTMGRYGVQFTYAKLNPTQPAVARPLRSLPDFEGILAPLGRQFICDAKVTSGASLKLDESHLTERQIRHMLRRSRFGAVCGLLVHCNERVLTRTVQPALTWAFPVHWRHPFWERVEAGEERSVSRVVFEEYGVPLTWEIPVRCRNATPRIHAAVEALFRLVKPLNED